MGKIWEVGGTEVRNLGVRQTAFIAGPDDFAKGGMSGF